jgi:hypothetical protein
MARARTDGRDSRTPAPAGGRTVKMTVLIDADSHRRLCVLATMRDLDRSALVCELLAPHLRGVTVQLRGLAGDGPRLMADPENPGENAA